MAASEADAAMREALEVLRALWASGMETPAALLAMVGAKSDPLVLAASALGIARQLLDELEDEAGEGAAEAWMGRLDAALRTRENDE
jgi:hypothetical protein